MNLIAEQPAPSPNDRPATWDLVIADAAAMFRTWDDPSPESLLVIEDMRARDAEGRRKYGTPLQPGNGRDSLVDAYQEILDACVYLRNVIAEAGDSAASFAVRNAYMDCVCTARRIRALILRRDGL